MATYISKRSVTLATRREAYDRIALLLQHLDGLNVNLLSLSLTAENKVLFVFNRTLPIEQVDHLDLDEAP